MYEQKLEAARRIIEQHNQNVEAESQIDIELFLEKLRKLGGTTEEALALCTWEDIQECGKTPRLIAKQIADVFRKKEDTRPKVITEKRALSMSLEELVAAYDPRDTENPVGRRLSQISGGLPFLVFNNADHTVNLAETLKCIEDLREGYEPRTLVMVDGTPQRVYRAGERPEQLMDENPLYPGRALRSSEQFCDQTNRSWKGIPHRARAILNLAITHSGELKIIQLTDAHNIIDLTVGKTEDQVNQLIATRFPKAALRFAELEKVGNMPTLKLVKNTLGRKQDPFFGNKTY